MDSLVRVIHFLVLGVLLLAANGVIERGAGGRTPGVQRAPLGLGPSQNQRLLEPHPPETMLAARASDVTLAGAAAAADLPAQQSEIALGLDPLGDAARVAEFVTGGPVALASDASAREVIGRYLRAGTQRMLFGIEPLALVLALMLAIKGVERIALTVIAFAIAHSLSLALGVWAGIGLPELPLRVATAFGIVFVAVQMTSSRRRDFLARRPWLFAFGFGLLHGLGFARDLSLPSGAAGLALACFNVGLELGLLLFVNAVAMLALLSDRLQMRWGAGARALPAYVMGSFAMCWVLESMLALTMR
jgi:hypothetical protein